MMSVTKINIEAHVEDDQLLQIVSSFNRYFRPLHL